MDRLANEPLASYATSGNQPVESSRSAVSWGAIVAGAVVAAGVTLILLALASGLGLASVSTWPNSGASLTTFSVMTAIGLIVVQWFASGIGGYVTGRLRTKWTGTHTHEVFFRDTAHGFIMWALSTVLVATLLASATASLVSAGAHGAAMVASGAAGSAMANSSAGSGGAGANGAGVNSGAQAGTLSPVGSVSAYNVDSLFRSAQPNANAGTSNADARAEATRILARSLTSGDVPATDRNYLAQLVAARTGISDADARKRVDDTIGQVQADETKARQAADTARKASAAASIFTALSMVIGAFIACAAAALGGQLRDQHP
jgi:hypothetical protein